MTNQKQENTNDNIMTEEEMLSIEGDVFDSTEALELEFVDLENIPESQIIN